MDTQEAQEHIYYRNITLTARIANQIGEKLLVAKLLARKTALKSSLDKNLIIEILKLGRDESFIK